MNGRHDSIVLYSLAFGFLLHREVHHHEPGISTAILILLCFARVVYLVVLAAKEDWL